MRNRLSFQVVLAMLIGLACPGFIVTGLANPSNRTPDAQLGVHATVAEAKALAGKLYVIYDRLHVLELEAIDKKDDPQRLPGRQLAQAAGELWKAIRDARHLQLMGEPAGKDIESKLVGAKGNILHYAIAWGRTPEGLKTKQKLKPQLERSIPKLQKIADRATGMLAAGQVDSYVSLVEGEGRRLAAQLAIFAPSDHPPGLDYLALFASGDDRVSRIRFEEYSKLGRLSMEANLDQAEVFVSQATMVVEQIEQSGKFTAGTGEHGDAAVAIQYLLDAWAEASAALLRAHALAVCYDPQYYSLSSGGFSDAGAVPAIDLEPKMIELNESAMRAIVSLIEATSANVASEDVRAVYAGLLQPLSAVVRRMGGGDGRLFRAFEMPLANLASKNPKFAASVAEYSHATTELLRWRQSFASKQAKHLSAEFPFSSALMAREVASSNNPEAGITVAPPVFNRWASLLVEDAVPHLVGKRVSDGAVRRLDSSGRLGVVPLSASHYSLIALPINVDEAFGELREALLVSDGFEPLTLDAADAVSAAEMQEFEAVGGVIRSVSLESRLVRFAALPAAAQVIQPPGKFPVLDADAYSPMKAACWRFDIAPIWVMHRCFIAKRESQESNE